MILFINQEKYCHQIKNDVCESHAYVYGLILSCIEDQRYTEIQNNTRASCYWHAIFAHACALTGKELPQRYTNWRSKCDSTFAQCGAGTVYEECPYSCLHSCSYQKGQRRLNSICTDQCIAGEIYLT